MNVSGMVAKTRDELKAIDDRAAIVKQLKAEAENRQSQFLSLAQKTLNGQAGAYEKASEDDIWKKLAGCNGEGL